MSEHDGLWMGPIEVRMIPRMRVGRARFAVAPEHLWPMVERVRVAVAGQRVAVAGVPILVFSTGAAQQPRPEVELRVPVSDLAAPLPADGERPAIEFVRLDRHKAACRMFNGPPGSALREAVAGLVAWVAQNRAFTADEEQHHVYMPTTLAHAISVEIRIPLR